MPGRRHCAVPALSRRVQMFRIRKIFDDSTPANQAVIEQAQDILRAQFSMMPEAEIRKLPEQLRNPLKFRYRSILFVAQGAGDRVRGVAVLLHLSDLGACYLESLSNAPGVSGRGIGAALYQRVREEARALDCIGLFFEALPDDPALSRDEAIRRQNAERLKFYERFGARPVAGTAYETPLREGGDNPPYLCFDPLERLDLPGRDIVRRIVRAILERKYAGVCPPDYVDMVVDSFRDDPIRLRPPRYVRGGPKRALHRPDLTPHIALVVNDRHDIHHMRDRGYVEAPVRVELVLGELEGTGLFQRISPSRYAETHIRAVHDGALVDFLRRACATLDARHSVYPCVFPIRNAARPPKELPLRAGYFCIDTFTPLNRNAYLAARRAVDCALTAADRVLQGDRFAYALVRPPGHHAERRSFGGFCYFNNAAIAAHYLSRYGRIAALDIDFHHGNGTQDIFYERADVLTVSIHGHPSFAYPYFSGFREEEGAGPGAGCNLNIPLPEVTPPDRYREALARALHRIDRFDPTYLVVALGLDTARGDPTGSWSNRPDDFYRIGEAIAAQGVPTLVVQEGGYRIRTLGANARSFFAGLWEGGRRPLRVARARPVAAQGPAAAAATIWRDEVRPGDVETVRSLLEAAGDFAPGEVTAAVALVEDRLSRGAAGDHRFLFAEKAGQAVGYACYGAIPETDRRFALYRIVVRRDLRRSGIGDELLHRVERAVALSGGVRLYVEITTRRPERLAAAFYRNRGYRKLADLPDFYRNGEGKAIYAKDIVLEEAASAAKESTDGPSDCASA